MTATVADTAAHWEAEDAVWEAELPTCTHLAGDDPCGQPAEWLRVPESDGTGLNEAYCTPHRDFAPGEVVSIDVTGA